MLITPTASSEGPLRLVGAGAGVGDGCAGLGLESLHPVIEMTTPLRIAIADLSVNSRRETLSSCFIDLPP